MSSTDARTSSIPRWLYPLMALLAAASIFSLSFRLKAESENKTVGIVTEYEVVEELAASQGISIDKAMEHLKAQGLTGLILSEQYLSDLVAGEEIQITPVGDGFRLDGPVVSLRRAGRGIMARYPAAQPELMLAGTTGNGSLRVPGMGSRLVRRTPLGLNPAECSMAKSHGLQIVCRHNNPEGVSDGYITKTLEWSKELGASVFLPSGDQVLGRRDSIGTLVDDLQRLQMAYATPEFSRLGGDENVVERIPGSVIRLHSAQSAELDKLPLAEAVDRFVRAAKERNHRLLLLRPLTSAAAQPVEAFGEFVGEVRQGLKSSGYGIGVPRAFRDPGIPRPLFVIIGLLAAPIIYWVGSVFVPSPRLRLLGAVLITLLAIACWFNLGRQLMALFAAMALPVAAFVLLDKRNGKAWLTEFLVMSMVSFVGGLTVAGLLNGLPYYVRADQFIGVKAAHFLPLLLIGAYFFVRAAHSPRARLEAPIRWMQAGIALLILVALALMFSRTGNDNPAAVSGVELKFRDILDTLLVVRPRTKEFLIGHPLLILGIGLMLLRKIGRPTRPDAAWIPLLMMGGAIGQTSIVNTMCHIHTPLALSLARLGVGLVAGGIIGAVLWMAVQRLQPKPVLEPAP